MINILLLRYIQLKRLLVEAGWIAILIGAIMGIMLVLRLLLVIQLNPWTAMLSALAPWTVHLQRKDKRLIQMLFSQNYPLYYWLEYNLVLMPWYIALIAYQIPVVYIGVAIMLTGLIGWVNRTVELPKIRQHVVLKSIMLEGNFEWIAGMRQHQWPIILIYIGVLIIGTWYPSGYLGIGLITMFFLSFFNRCESLPIVLLEATTAQSFLYQKILFQTKQYLVFVGPLMVLYGIHYPEKLLFFIALQVVYVLNYLVFILNKYKSYQPNIGVPSNTVIGGFLFVGMFLPYMFPISMVLCFVFYQKSIRNLKFYFNA